MTFIIVWLLGGLISAIYLGIAISKRKKLNNWDYLLLFAVISGGFLTALFVYLDYRIEKTVGKIN